MRFTGYSNSGAKLSLRIQYEQQIDHPMIVARESRLRMIEPAAGPTLED